jgi:type I restriction enzyme R subunit
MEEERRAAGEGLSEDELAVFDLLTKPKPKLSKAQEVAVKKVKKVARELLEKLQDQLTVAEWQTKQQTRAAVQSSEHHPVHSQRIARGAVSRAGVE